jgi:predicted O-methyltransferase YrrM
MTPRELDALTRLVRERAKPGRHLEIGTAAGGTLCELIRAAVHAPPFVVIDPMTYFSNQKETVERNLEQHGISLSQVDIRVTRSWDEFHRAQAAGERFDFILIDGTHKFRYVVQDLHWAGQLETGGILALHDYTPQIRAVRTAANHFLSRNSNYRHIELVDTLLILEKTAPDGPRGVRLMPDAAAAIIHPLFQLENSVRKRLGLPTTA